MLKVASCSLQLTSAYNTQLQIYHKMEAFVGKFERTSADKYEEMLKVDGRGTATECRE